MGPVPTNETTLVPSHLEQTRFGASKYAPEFDVQGKVIVVTGGGGRLGLSAWLKPYFKHEQSVGSLRSYTWVFV